MKFIPIRSPKSDSITIHAITCQVAVKHYAKMKCFDLSAMAEDSIAEALEGQEFHGTEVKICGCAKA